MISHRVSSANTYDATIQRIQQRSAQLAHTQDQLSAGKRVLRASDDPVATSLAERENNRLQRAQADLRALEQSRSSLELTEGTMGQAVEVVQRIQELIVQGGNSTLAASDRESVANELKGLKEQLFNLANTKDANGNALFGGLGATGSDGRPFSPITLYQAVAGQMQATETNVPLRIDGAEAFSYVSETDNLFQTVQAAIDAIDPAVSATLDTAGLDTAHGKLKDGLDQMMVSRGRVGEWLRRSDTIDSQLQDRSVASQKEISDLTDLDMVKGISDFQGQQQGLQAALQSYGQVQKLSLFQYIA